MSSADSKLQAERLRIGIRAGWLSVTRAVEWAEDQIAAQSRPDPALFDIALGARLENSEMAAALAAVPGTCEPTAAMRLALRDLLERVEREPSTASEAAQWIYSAAVDGELPDAAFGHEPYGVHDAFQLAERATYGTVEGARERLIAFLEEQSASRDGE